MLRMMADQEYDHQDMGGGEGRVAYIGKTETHC